MTAVLFELAGTERDPAGILWSLGDLGAANHLLAAHHYLGPITAGGCTAVVTGTDTRGDVVAAQVWRRPTARRLPANGAWLELSRWCLTPAAGVNAGSRQHRAAVRIIRSALPQVTTLVSYSDPSAGHTGALYRACNWLWRPTWHRLRPPPTGHGSWTAGRQQQIKDRWIFPVRRDPIRDTVTAVGDRGAIRHWLRTATEQERAWARDHPELGPALR